MFSWPFAPGMSWVVLLNGKTSNPHTVESIYGFIMLTVSQVTPFVSSLTSVWLHWVNPLFPLFNSHPDFISEGVLMALEIWRL